MAAETRKAKLHTYCKFCKVNGVKRLATVMTRFAPKLEMRNTYKHYSCEDHKHLLEDTDPQRDRSVETETEKKTQLQPVDEHYTEADYQTWLRL